MVWEGGDTVLANGIAALRRVVRGKEGGRREGDGGGRGREGDRIATNRTAGAGF